MASTFQLNLFHWEMIFGNIVCDSLNGVPMGTFFGISEENYIQRNKMEIHMHINDANKFISSNLQHHIFEFGNP